MNRRLFLRIATALVAVACILITTGVLSAQSRGANGLDRALAAQEQHTRDLMAKPGVVGTAVGLGDDGNPAVLVLLEHGNVAGIPARVDGVKVKKLVTGKIYALPKGGKPDKPEKPGGGKPGGGDKINPKKRCERPVPIGVSTGNEGECSSGTIGCRVVNDSGTYALSNNHVYALENNAAPDSRVLQPGRYDAKPPCTLKEADVIGNLYAYVPMDFAEDGSNVVDAAIAECTTDMLGNATPPDGYGIPGSTAVPAVIEMSVQKYGRTTGLTSGTVIGVNAYSWVTYSTGSAYFVDQIIIGGSSFSSSGDSGSLIVTNDDKCSPVGLLFAGSSTYTIANRIDLVLSELGVTIDGK